LDKVLYTINLLDIEKHTSKKINIMKLAECKNNNNNLPLRHDIKADWIMLIDQEVRIK